MVETVNDMFLKLRQNQTSPLAFLNLVAPSKKARHKQNPAKSGADCGVDESIDGPPSLRAAAFS
jgi:hypothetical protein